MERVERNEENITKLAKEVVMTLSLDVLMEWAVNTLECIYSEDEEIFNEDWGYHMIDSTTLLQ